jgi:MFS family permease
VTTGAPFRETFSSLQHRNFRLFFIGQSISNSGNWLTNVALTLLVLNLTGQGVGVGALTAFQFGPMLLLSAWGGAVADRYDKRRLLLVTQSLEMGQSFALAALAFLPRPPLPLLYALALVGGILLSLDNPLRRSFVAEMVPSKNLPNAVVLYSAIVNLSRIFGPALAGLLVITVCYGWCFVVDALSYIAVLACLVMMRPEELHRQPGRVPMRGAVREALRHVRDVPALRTTFAMLAIVLLLAYNFNVTLPLFVTMGLGAGEGMYTALYSVLSAGSVTGALVLARRTRVGARDVVIGAVVLGTALLLLSLVPGVRLAVPAVFVLGMASIFYVTSSTTLMQLEARRDMQGRVLSLQTVLLGGGAAFGGPLLGWIADRAGARVVIGIGGLACLVAASVGALLSRPLDAPRPPDDLSAADDGLV